MFVNLIINYAFLVSFLSCEFRPIPKFYIIRDIDPFSSSSYSQYKIHHFSDS